MTFVGLMLDEFEGAQFFKGEKPWRIPCDIALTCATQNELNEHDAELLLQHKPLCVAEVSNMGCTAEAVDLFLKANQLFAPGKAVNAGGVATSGLEITQNNLRLPWSEKKWMKNYITSCTLFTNNALNMALNQMAISIM